MEEDQVIAEWHMLVQAAKTPSAYLSSFHAFVLANALRRPILVYGDRFVRGRNGEPYAPSDVRGVYLPTLVDPEVCYKLPIAVGYTCVAVGKVGHFTALVGVDRELRHLPLVDEHGDDLPIRYGLPPATVANPHPEEDFLEDYLMTTLFYTEEGKQYPMAVLRGAYMTPEAADVRAAMAQTAVTAFDRLAKEQEEEIKRALLASEGENDNPPIPIPIPIPTPTPAPASADGDGDNQGPTPSPPGPPVPSAPSEAKLPPPPPPAAIATKKGDGLGSWSGSSTADLSDGPTAGLFVDDGNGGRDKGAVAGGGGPTAIAGGGGAVALRGGGAGCGEAGSAGAAPRADGAAASLSAAGYDDGGGGGDGGGDAVGVPAGEAGRSGGEDDTDGVRARLARPESSAPAEGNGDGVGGGIERGGGEDVSPVASPPIGSRLLSAPLDMLSAVGAWATGRGRFSVGSAASDTAAAAAAVAAATATAASSSLSDGGRTASSSESSISSTAAGDPPALPRSGDGVVSRTGGSGIAGDGAQTGTLAVASPLDLRLDDFSGHGGGGDSGESSSGRPPSVHVPREEEDGMDLNGPPPNGNGGAEVAATINGKRKPVCSPAVTPEGPNPGQHFGDTRSTAVAAAAAAAGVEEDWRVANTAAAPGSRRRSKGRSSTGTAGPPPPPARRAATVAGADDAAAAVGQEEGEKPGEPTGVAASVRAFAAATEAYHATERWRSARSGGAGSRRGQPHPRGSSPGGDGEAATGGRSSNPWLATSSLAIAAAERRLQGESQADEDGRRLAAGGGSSSHGGGGEGGATGAQAGGGGETRTETAPPKARYHSRTRRSRGEDPSGAPVNRYTLTERGSRSVQDGIDTMSLASSIASGERRYYSSGRLPHVAAVAAGANHDFDLGGGYGGSSSDAYHLEVAAATSPTRRRRASAAGGGTQSGGRRESSNPPPPRELSDYRLYPRSAASTTEARARRAGAGEGEARSSRGMSSSSSSLSRDGGRCSLARSSSGGGGGGGVGRDVGDGFAGDGDEGRERRNRGESAGYYSYGGSSYSFGARAGSSTASLSRQLSGSGRSPSPAVARPSSASRKSDYLRAAARTRPGSSSSSSTLSRAALTGRRSPLRTSISSSSSSVSASSYPASSGQLGTAASAAAGFPSNVPGAVLTEQQGLSARGGLPARAGSGGGGGGSVRSNGSVRSGRSYSGSCSGSNAGYDGQTLSEIRRSLAARERREVKATSVGAPRSRKAYADTPKFY
ncbi:unnamed protein product [Ectocarpus sp. 4 AP-2014]